MIFFPNLLSDSKDSEHLENVISTTDSKFFQKQVEYKLSARTTIFLRHNSILRLNRDGLMYYYVLDKISEKTLNTNQSFYKALKVIILKARKVQTLIPKPNLRLMFVGNKDSGEDIVQVMVLNESEQVYMLAGEFCADAVFKTMHVRQPSSLKPQKLVHAVDEVFVGGAEYGGGILLSEYFKNVHQLQVSLLKKIIIAESLFKLYAENTQHLKIVEPIDKNCIRIDVEFALQDTNQALLAIKDSKDTFLWVESLSKSDLDGSFVSSFYEYPMQGRAVYTLGNMLKELWSMDDTPQHPLARELEVLFNEMTDCATGYLQKFGDLHQRVQSISENFFNDMRSEEEYPLTHRSNTTQEHEASVKKVSTMSLFSGDRTGAVEPKFYNHYKLF